MWGASDVAQALLPARSILISTPSGNGVKSGAETSLGAADTSDNPPFGQSLAPVTSAHGSKQVKFSVNAANSTVCPVFSSMWLLESVRATGA